jgi:hypothetical protein
VSVSNGGSSEDLKKLQEENKKLRYRNLHLLRALDEIDGGSPSKAKSASHVLNFFCLASQYELEVLQCKFVAALTGCSLNVQVVSETERTSKEMKTKNPLGVFPFIESESGPISGLLSVCKHICRLTGKLQQDND